MKTPVHDVPIAGDVASALPAPSPSFPPSTVPALSGPSPRTTARLTLVVVAVLAVVALGWQLRGLIGLLFAAIVLASSIRPFVENLRRRGVPHGAAVGVVYAVLGTLVLALLYAAIPPLLSLIVDIVRDDLLGRRLRVLFAELTLLGWHRFEIVLPVVSLPNKVQQFFANASVDAGRQAVPLTLSMLTGVGNALLVLVLAFYWVLARDQTLNIFFRLAPPESRLKALRLWRDVETRLGAWVRGQLTVMGVVAVFVLLMALGLRLPYAIALAAIAGLLQVIPFLGPFLGALPAVIVAATVSGGHAILVLAFFLLLQQVETSYLTPRIMHESTGLNPLIVVLAVVAGGLLGGPAGAVLGVPAAAVLQTVLEHTYLDPNTGLAASTASVVAAKSDPQPGVGLSAAGSATPKGAATSSPDRPEAGVGAPIVEEPSVS